MLIMSSTDKVETTAGNYRRQWEEKKMACLAERSMEAEEEERRKSCKVVVIKEGDDETKKMQKETRKRRIEIMRAHPFVFLTRSQMQEYNKRVIESGGFDVGDIPYNTMPEGVPVRPIDLGRHPDMLVMIENLSSFAIEGFNERKKTEYQFQKVLKANVRWALPGSYRGFYYYITFQVKDIKCPGSSLVNFQAKIYYFEGDTKVSGGQQACPPITKVLSCRPEP